MKHINRRQFLGSTAVVALTPALLISSRNALASDDNKVEPESAQAKAFSYVHETAKADQNCANCQLYTGPAGTSWGPCALFPGKQVAANGWCSAWVKKAS